MREVLIRWLLWVGGLVLGVAILGWATTPLVQAATGPLAPDVAVALAAAAAAWLICGWLLLAAAAALVEAGLATAGGRLGRARWPGRLTRRITPSSLRTAVRRSLRSGLAVGALTSAALTGVGVLSAPAQATTVAAWYAPVDDPTSPPLPSVDRPATSEQSNSPAPTGRVRYTVRPGDTLWGIAAAHLPGRPTNASVSDAWPLWWQANRSVIGDDPDLIRPGQVLRAPR